MSTFLFYLIYVLYLSLQLIVTSFTSLLMSGVDLANVCLLSSLQKNFCRGLIEMICVFSPI